MRRRSRGGRPVVTVGVRPSVRWVVRMAEGGMLARMRGDPRGGWTVADVEAVCRQAGLRCSPPAGGGSHRKVSHPAVRDILTVPARRPIKPVCVRKLVRMVEEAGG